MDFDIKYTSEQEQFREEVRDWMEAHARPPKEIGKFPLEGRHTTRQQYQWMRQFYRELGHKGWFYPTMPKEYGGGGLTLDHDIIIKEELARFDAPTQHSPGNVAVAPLFIYGTEEQKQRFLKPLLMGEVIVWQLWTEPDSGVDLASIKMRATPTGDDFVFNGVKNYISGIYEPDWLNTLAVTDPDAPRHANLGQFYLPANLPGISWEYQDLIVKGGQQFVYFNDVRVPREYLIGGETQGWRVTQSSLELEHGAEGSLSGRENVVNDLLSAWQGGAIPRSLGDGANARSHLVNAYILSHVNRLLSRRNFWMFHTHEEQSYHGSQVLWHGRETRIRTAEDILEALGPHALTNDQQWRLLDGRVELGQRGASMATHGAGSYEIDKVTISRRIGLSRTKEVAAPTH